MSGSAAGTPATGAPRPDGHRPGWTAGRVIVAVCGGVAALIGALLLLLGLALVLVHVLARDSDGYYTTGTERLATRTYALTVKDLDLGSEAADAVPKDILGTVRIRAERRRGGPVFIGIGPEQDVDAYLRGVAHAKLDDLDPPKYVVSRGGAPRSPPGDERFWVASTDGPGRQSLTWDVEGGHWSIVAMNSRAARGVVVDADVGAKVGWFLGVGIGLLVAGLLIVAGGVVLIVVAARRAG
jgi:hypothetical protein